MARDPAHSRILTNGKCSQSRDSSGRHQTHGGPRKEDESHQNPHSSSIEISGREADPRIHSQKACVQAPTDLTRVRNPGGDQQVFPLYPGLLSRADNTLVNEPILCLNSLFFGPAVPRKPPLSLDKLSSRAPPFKAAASIRHRIHLSPLPASASDDPEEFILHPGSASLSKELPIAPPNHRGSFAFLTADRISLPDDRPPPSPFAGLKWIDRLPQDFREALQYQDGNSFLDKLTYTFIDGPEAEYNRAKAPDPKLYAAGKEYVSFLQLAMESGILAWSSLTNEDPREQLLLDTICCTLFAVTKNADNDRLITWPRTQNEFLPEPPKVSLPDPSLYPGLQTPTSNLKACFLDVKDMFHNILLPPHLAKLFPMPVVHFGSLSASLQNAISTTLRMPLREDDLVRPLQATLPMGFSWSVGIAHYLAQSCITEAFRIFKDSRLSPNETLAPLFFLRENLPLILTKSSPLVLHTIDDISIVTHKWRSDAVLLLYKILRTVLTAQGLPVKQSKSSSFHKVEENEITFIGCVWRFNSGNISPSEKHISKIRKDMALIMQSERIQTFCFDRTVGRMVWLSLLNRPVLSTMMNIFNVPDSLICDGAVHVNAKMRRELLMGLALMPLCSFNTNLPLAQIVICFDASLTHGSVVATETTRNEIENLWNACQRDPKEPGRMVTGMKHFLQIKKWTHVKQKIWKKDEPIYALEASTAIMALKWLVGAGFTNQRVIIATDSDPVRFALSKGRSSCVPMMLRCRAAAAITIAYNIRAHWTYINTKSNPADPFSRPSPLNAKEEF